MSTAPHSNAKVPSLDAWHVVSRDGRETAGGGDDVARWLLRIVSWNIHKGIGGIDRTYQIGRVIEVLRKQHPDIVLLQEVAEGFPRAGHDNQLLLLSEALQLPHVAYGREHRFRVGGYGNAILSRYHLTDEQHVDLTVGRYKKRGAIVARAHISFDGHTRSLVIFNLHLGLRAAERALQLRRFLDCHPFARLHGKTPVLVGGDMNDVWGTLGPQILAPNGFHRVGGVRNTFPAWFPVRPLDGLYARGDLDVVECTPLRSGLARVASDHLPLVASFKLLD
jgi:endonuclease/exonuclease/phosphatase family metal-dependent hydrolase